jgi:hypothetical protein
VKREGEERKMAKNGEESRGLERTRVSAPLKRQRESRLGDAAGRRPLTHRRTLLVRAERDRRREGIWTDADTIGLVTAS